MEGPLTIGQGEASFGCGWIEALHLFGHLLDNGRLVFEQTGPHPLVLGARGRWGVVPRPAAGREHAFYNLLWSTHPRCAGEDDRHRGPSFLVRLLPFGQPRLAVRTGVLLP